MRKSRPVSAAQQGFTFTRRTMFVGGVQAAFGLILAGRMAYISVAENEKYKLQAESNRVNLTLIPPRRGWFIDRTGKPIATNRADFRVDIIPDRVINKEATIATLSKLLALNADDVERITRELKDGRGFQPCKSPPDWIMTAIQRSAFVCLNCRGLARVRAFPAIIPAAPPSAI